MLEIKETLKAIADEQAEGVKIRSKELWTEFGKKLTKYFFQLEHKRQTKNAITTLRVGSVTYETDKEILVQALDFYKSLYSEEPVVPASQDWLVSQLNKSLAFEDQAHSEGELTLSECYDALAKMESGKSPGNDGLPAEFYLYFWGLIGRDLVDTLNYGYHEGSLSVTTPRHPLATF